MSRNRKQESVTLIELLIAITLLSVIVLGISSIEIFSRFHVVSSGRRVQLQNEASLILEHMAKHISAAIGDAANPAARFYNQDSDIRVKTDTNQNGMRDDGDIDLWIAYRYEGGNNPSIAFYRNAGEQSIPNGNPDEILSRRVVINPVGLVFAYTLIPGTDSLADNHIGIVVTLRWNPAQSASVDNPEVNMQSRIKMPAVSTN